MWSKPELELVLASNFGLGVHEIARKCPQPSSEGPNHDAATYIKVGFLYSTSQGIIYTPHRGVFTPPYFSGHPPMISPPMGGV